MPKYSTGTCPFRGNRSDSGAGGLPSLYFPISRTHWGLGPEHPEKITMSICLKTFAAVSILGFVATADAQFAKKASIGSANAQSAATAEPGPASPAEQLRALQHMNEAAGDHLAASNQRIKQMTEYLSSKGLLDEYKSTSNPPKMLPQAMGFQEAFEVAIKHDSALGPVDSDMDPAMVSREVAAYTTMVKSVWSQYQDAMVTVQRMTDFMNDKGCFDGYISWAGDEKTKMRDEMVASAHERAEADKKKDATREAETEKDQKAAWSEYHKHHQEMLDTAWQHYKFNDKMRLQYYKYSQEYSHGYWNNYGDSYGDVY